MVGLSILPATVNDGPIARMITRCGAVPRTIVPANKTLSPVWTNPRVEILASFESTFPSRS
jgi:hypothetical protein